MARLEDLMEPAARLRELTKVHGNLEQRELSEELLSRLCRAQEEGVTSQFFENTEAIVDRFLELDLAAPVQAYLGCFIARYEDDGASRRKQALRK